MRRLLTVTAFILLATLHTFGQAAKGTAQSASDEQALRELDRQLLDARLKGDRKFLEGLWGESVVYTGASGRLTTRDEMLKTLQPTAPEIKFSFERRDVRVQLYGDAAVVTGRTVVTALVGGQTVHSDERTTHTYVRRDGRWRLVASHTSEPPPERAVAKIDPKLYEAYAGEYQLSPSLVYVVTVEGGKLMGQGTNQGKPSSRKLELLPINETTFYARGETGDIVFVLNDKGEVTHLLFREGGQDIKATRIK